MQIASGRGEPIGYTWTKVAEGRAEAEQKIAEAEREHRIYREKTETILERVGVILPH